MNGFQNRDDWQPWGAVVETRFNKCCSSGCGLIGTISNEVLGRRMTKEIRGMELRLALLLSVPVPHSAGAVAIDAKLVPKQPRFGNPTEFRRANGLGFDLKATNKIKC
jgi:hypothetical protein